MAIAVPGNQSIKHLYQKDKNVNGKDMQKSEHDLLLSWFILVQIHHLFPKKLHKHND